MKVASQTAVQWWIMALGIFSAIIAHAAPVDAKRAQVAVNGWLNRSHNHLAANLGRLSGKVDTFADGSGNSLYHVVNLAPEGFVVVSADDLIEPIVCFSPRGQFDPSPENPLYALVSNDLPRRIARTRGVHALAVQSVASAHTVKWAALESAAQPGLPAPLGVSVVSDLRVAPLIQTLWGQTTASASSTNACYNYYTPPYAAGSSSNYPSGCIATALSQILFYWRYPVAAVSTNTCTFYVSGVQQSGHLRGGDGVGGPYDWGNMVLDPASACTHVQCQAIGALCSDAGMAVGMGYSYGSSATASWLQQYALTHAFGYTNAVCSESAGPNGSLDPADFMTMINPNLDAGRPVLLGIAGTHGAHAIVCDGYGYNLSTLYHHLNMGWSGEDNTWYALPLVDPSDVTYTFTLIQAVIYNIFTNRTGEIVSGRILTAGGVPLAGAAVSATRVGGGTYTAMSDASGIYALAGIPSASAYTVSVVKAGCTFADVLVTTGWSTNFSIASGNRWGSDVISSEPAVTLSLSADPLTKTGGAAIVTATLSKTSALSVTVNLAFSGTAVADSDYTASASTIVIPSGSLCGSIVLTALPNRQKRGNETIVVDIDTVIHASELGTQRVVALITDGNAPPDDPLNFRVRAANSSSINLQWAKNTSNDNVLVAWNINSDFGTPFATYSTNAWISGGGTVLYAGSATNFVHACLVSTTSYYYRAWSVHNGSNYSLGVTCSATTSNRTLLPYTYGFENADDFFATWPWEIVSGGMGWSIAGRPHTDAKGASFYNPSAIGAKTKMLAPMFDFGTGAQNAQLSFWYCVQSHGTTQDALRVFCKTNASGPYTLLGEYTNSVSLQWNSCTLTLPGPNSSYYVAFEGEIKGGYGVYVDDVSVTATYPATNSFSAWKQLFCPGINITNAFSQNYNNDGVPNGFKYALGTNWAPGLPLLEVRMIAGLPVVEVPAQDATVSAYATTTVETTSDLQAPAWTNRMHVIGGAPANRAWFQPNVVGSNNFFRLRATLLE